MEEEDAIQTRVGGGGWVVRGMLCSSRCSAWEDVFPPGWLGEGGGVVVEEHPKRRTNARARAQLGKPRG